VKRSRTLISLEVRATLLPAAKQARGKGKTEADKVIATDAFAAALDAVPAEDWCRTWAACRTIMLRRTSKRVKEAVDKMCPPSVVRWNRSLWDDARNGTTETKLEFVWRQLAAMKAGCTSSHSRCRSVQ
jgi:hypothetical protein